MQAKVPDDARLREMGGGRILPLLWKFAWPALVTMTLNQLYNVIDRVYIGNGCGRDAIAGLAMTFPVMMVMGAFGPLIGVGSGTVISISLGEKNPARAERALGQCVALKLLLGVTVAPALFVFLDPILHAMAGGGVTDGAIAAARLYLRINVLFHFLAHLAFGLSACMRSEGSPVAAMRCMVAGAVANLVLDPFFIFERVNLRLFSLPGLGLGVAGAAWATNIAMGLACLAALLHYTGGRSVVKLRLRNVRVYGDLVPRVLAIGLSPFLMQFAGSTINFSLNKAFSHWSGSPAEGTVQIAAFGIFLPVSFLFFMPSMGIQQGFAPIIGYNWGARNLARVRRCLDTVVLLTTAAVACACLAQMLFARPLAWCFAQGEPDVVRAGAFALRLGNCMVWCIGLNVAATTYFQAIGRPRTAIVLSLLRQVIVLLPCVWILPRVLPRVLPIDPLLAVWISLPISDVAAFLASIPPVLRERRALARAGAGA
ncbi:MAG: MATE family efflux transporter [Kiritimatiellae bacterium]|nr:MATE family efflux transporter [Kiritimatiellia bacterium]